MTAAPPFQVYVHVPYCARRCGYCDFNTYVAPAADRAVFADAAISEMELAARELAGQGREPRPAANVYFGGGTPTLLPAADLVRMHDAVRRVFGLTPGAEVTAEANPDTVSPAYLLELAAGGFTRVSIGMQSAQPHVLAMLERSHSPENVAAAVAGAKAAGLGVSVDLIYGAPGETLADWEGSVRAALDLGLDHISAYALTLEPHTPLARRVKAGLAAEIDPDEMADKYELADSLFEAASLNWYEISNWAKSGFESRHNLGYWLGSEWWGIGPGAHSAIGRERFWNVKSPRAHAAMVARGQLPLGGRDRLSAASLEVERVMLSLRTVRGVELDGLAPPGRAAAERAAADGLGGIVDGRLVLTRRGRLLADTVTRSLISV
ncbi:MAG: radical SAM family heme chaperone HemW [Bifidobacteriaceae bacterium]|jgi:oxygen-independent coproporphyrinogen-3 oxidase|nr:radical SAM family heme chaperone HemW [Bifidobacteriaceae bacterium]